MKINYLLGKLNNSLIANLKLLFSMFLLMNLAFQPQLGHSKSTLGSSFILNPSFALAPPSIAGTVWEDLNGDGIQNDGATGIFGVTVNLDGAASLSTTTDVNGDYTFEDLAPGNYFVTFVLTGDYNFTAEGLGGDETIDSDADESTGETVTMTLAVAEAITDVDAGFFLFASIGDFVWEDLNANGVQDGEPGLADVTVTLDGLTGAGDAVTATTTTDGTGAYLFDEVIPGEYTLNFDAGGDPYAITFQDQGGDDNSDSDIDNQITFNSGTTASFTVESDDVVDNMDAGFFEYATIGDYTWMDTNGNGLQDDGTPIGGVSVDLDGTAGDGNPIATMTTSSDGTGFYEFTNVIPGTYYVTFTLPGGADAITFQDQGADDEDSDADPTTGETGTIDVESGDTYQDFDCGFYAFVTISDLCWEDTNGNGIQEGEPGLEGVTVRATRTSDGFIYNTTSGAGGIYEFTELSPGEYSLFFGIAGYFLTGPDMTTEDADSDPDPTTGNTPAYTYESGDTDDSVDAGFWYPTRVGDFSWKDLNTDGIQDGGAEIGFAFVDVEINGTTGWGEAVSATGTTNAAGIYIFDNVPPGEYQITFTTPASYTESPFQAGGDNSVDSDAAISDFFTIESGINNFTIDAGYFVEPPEDCDQQPASNCEQADILCDIEDIHDYCTEMLPPWNPGIPDPLCPSGGYAHNPSWFAFVAADDDVTLILHASDCSVGGGQQIGIQYGVYTDCTFSESVVCQPDCENPGDINVNITGLTPGEDYFFFIDGCNGTICTYWIEIVSGGGFYEVDNPTGISCSDEDGDCDNICLGAAIDFTLDDCENAVDYVWTIDGVVDETLTDQTVAIDFFTEGTYEICGYGQNVCHVSETVCTTVNVEAVDDVDLGEFEVCANDLEIDGYEPEDWDGGVINTPGTHVTTTSDEYGCAYEQTAEIIELPNETAIVDTLVCDGDIIDYFGNTFTYNIENEPITIDNGGNNGCDKFVDFSATFMTLDFALIEGPICIGNEQFRYDVLNVLPYPEDITDIQVQWYLNNDPIGDLITTAPYSIIVTEEGFYNAEVILTKNGVSCTYILDDGEQLYFDDLLPLDAQQSDWILAYCNNVGDTLTYSVFDPNFENTYIWTYPNDVNYAYVDEINATLYIDWTGSDGGELCVQAQNDCGVSEPLCEIIEISPGPNAEFTLPSELCLTDLADITYTGTATDNASFDWVFSGGIDTSGNNNQGVGPYVLTWNSSGPKNVSLTVIENGCISPLETQMITLEEPIQEPFVSCQSNQSSIIFSWDDILNSEGYDVELIEGTAGSQLDNTYTVSGLNPLDSVSIIVSALNDGLCPPTYSDTITCYALDCPAVTLDIFIEDTTICYTGGGAPFILDHILSPAGLGDSWWTGKGIIDSETGLFHPDSAGFGTHQIRLNYTVDNCTFNDQAVINIFEEPTADFTISTDSICNTDNVILNYIGNTPGGNATWSFDNANYITGTGLAQHTANWLSEGWKTISLEVSQNGCVSETVTKMVYIEEALPDIDVDCESTVDSIIFTWPNNDQIEGYLIFIDGVLIDSLNVNSWTVYNLSEGDNVHFTLEGINSGICANIDGSQDCEAKPCPVFAVDITPTIDSICLEAGVSPIQFIADLTGAEIPGVTSWSGNGIGGNSGLFDPEVAGPGTHTITYSYAEGSCDIDTSFVITVLEQPVTDFSVDKAKICITDRVNITINNYNPTFEYIWDIESAVVSQISQSIQEAFWTVPGAYDISLYVTNDICESEMITYTVEVEPELIEPTVSCDPYTDRIILNWTKVDCAATYQVFVDGSLLEETTDNQITILNMDPAQQVDVQIIAVSECSCPNIATSIQCETLDCASVELSINELPFSVCENEASSVMTLNENIVGATGGSLQWSGNNIGTTDGVLQLGQLTPGDHLFTLNYDLDNCYYEFSDVLTIYPEVNFDVNSTDPSCNDMLDGTISINTNTGTAPFTYLINGTSYAETSVDQLGPGDYTIEITDENACNASTQISLVNPSLVVPKINGLEVLQEKQGSTYTLTFDTQPTGANYTWHFQNGDTLAVNAPSVEVSDILAESVLCVDVDYNNGSCVETACFTIRFEEIVDVYIPNVFSPNQDDKNDKFYIKADDSVTSIKTMRIYDRWGELLFEKANFAPNDKEAGWDGTFGTTTLLPGVYVYDIVVVTKENKEFRYTGDITLIR